MGKIDKLFEILEPRILLDGTLEFAVSDTVGNAETIEAMNALIRDFETQFDPDDTEGLLGLLKAELGDSLDGISNLVALADGQDAVGFGELDDVFERVRLAGMQVVEEYRSNVNDAVNDAIGAADIPALISLDDMNSEIMDIADSKLLRVNDVDVPNGMDDPGLLGYLLSPAVTDQIFGSDLLLSNTPIEDRINAFFDTLIVEVGETIPDPDSMDMNPPMIDAFEVFEFQTDTTPTTIDEFKAAFNAAYDDILDTIDTNALDVLDLQNVTASGGETLVEFTNAVDAMGAPLNTVTVTVNLPDMQTLLDRLDLDPNLRTVLPVDFGFSASSGTFSFDIGAETTFDDAGTAATEDDITTAQLTLSGFDLQSGGPEAEAALFEFGRPILATDQNYQVNFSDLEETSVGFLTGTLTSIETGRFGLYEADADWSALVYDGTVTIAADPAVVLAAASTLSGQTAINFDARAQGLDGNSLDVIIPGTVIDLVRYTLDMDLPLSLDATTGIGFEASLTQSVILDDLITDGSIEDLSSGVNTQFAITSFAGLPAPQIEPLTRLANAFYQMNVDVIETFFETIGDGLASVLRSSEFSVGIPLTDFELTAAFSDIAETLGQLPDLFRASPADFGFNEENLSDGSAEDGRNRFIELASELLVQTGLELSDDQIRDLDARESLTFTFYSQDADGALTQDDAVVDLTSWSAFDAFGILLDDALVTLSGLINASLPPLGTFGWAASAAGRALSLTVTGTDAIRNLSTSAGTTFRDLGFGQSQLLTNEISGTEITTLEVNRENQTVILDAFDTGVLRGMDSVRFEVVTNDDPVLVNVVQPTNGWGSDTGGDVLQSFINATDNALQEKGLGVSVSLAPAGDRLQFSLDSGAEGRFQIALDLESLNRANSLQGVMGWVTDIITDIPLIPAVDIQVDLETGDVLFDFEPIENEISTSAGFSIDDTNLGELENVDLQATLAGQLSAMIDFSAGFNIFDIQSDFAENNEIASAILDNTFFTDLNVNAVLDATATEIVAELDLGLVEIGVGTENTGASAANFIALNTELDISLVGQKDAAFSDRLTGSQLITLGTEAGPGTRLTDLLGRIDLQGGIAVNEDGAVVDMAGEYEDFGQFGDTATAEQVLGLLDIDNGDDRVDDQDYAMIVMNFQDIEFNLGGIGSDALEGFSTPVLASTVNIFDPINTTRIHHGFDELTCLTLIDPNLILDALIGLGDLIDVYAENLETYFPVLFENVPLLNDALLAGFDFTSGFNDALQELRDAGGFSFANINEVFASAFGEDVVTINLLTETEDPDNPGEMLNICELYFDLNLSFLDDFTQTIPFNFNLIDLLGEDGLQDLLQGIGEEDTDEMTPDPDDDAPTETALSLIHI